MTYKFKYENKSATSTYRVLRQAQENGDVLSFKETLSDGTTTEYDAEVSVKRTGGGVNGVVEVEAKMTICSDLKVTDPS